MLSFKKLSMIVIPGAFFLVGVYCGHVSKDFSGLGDLKPDSAGLVPGVGEEGVVTRQRKGGEVEVKRAAKVAYYPKERPGQGTPPLRWLGESPGRQGEALSWGEVFVAEGIAPHALHSSFEEGFSPLEGFLGKESGLLEKKIKKKSGERPLALRHGPAQGRDVEEAIVFEAKKRLFEKYGLGELEGSPPRELSGAKPAKTKVIKSTISGLKSVNKFKTLRERSRRYQPSTREDSSLSTYGRGVEENIETQRRYPQ